MKPMLPFRGSATFRLNIARGSFPISNSRSPWLKNSCPIRSFQICTTNPKVSNSQAPGQAQNNQNNNREQTNASSKKKADLRLAPWFCGVRQIRAFYYKRHDQTTVLGAVFRIAVLASSVLKPLLEAFLRWPVLMKKINKDGCGVHARLNSTARTPQMREKKKKTHLCHVCGQNAVSQLLFHSCNRAIRQASKNIVLRNRNQLNCGVIVEIFQYRL